MIYLDKEDIVFINQRTVSEHGGHFMPPHNFLHEENLDYLLEAVQAEMFGEPLYPSVPDKAAIYCYNIICNHIFSDGNKRTGLEAALAFLKLNGMRLKRDLAHSELYDFIISVASGQVSLEECRMWFAAHTITVQ
ncbi:type II toxin-antitoxin system death-on-curing family toxin [Nibrella saemangeumensis]|uniref:Type II toxin-antitoxin system death-on-curing family toxin n=1 Tax=Nibrella saemangeumensis TaxID=1084526 RepID=A0ABP8MIJ9_9BACT